MSLLKSLSRLSSAIYELVTTASMNQVDDISDSIDEVSERVEQMTNDIKKPEKEEEQLEFDL